MFQFEHVLVGSTQPVVPPDVVFWVRNFAPAAASNERVNRAGGFRTRGGQIVQLFVLDTSICTCIMKSTISPLENYIHIRVVPERFLRPVVFADRCPAFSTALAGRPILGSPGCDRIAIVRRRKSPEVVPWSRRSTSRAVLSRGYKYACGTLQCILLDKPCRPKAASFLIHVGAFRKDRRVFGPVLAICFR